MDHHLPRFTEAVLDQRHGAYRPRCGISDGWVPARVVADQHEKDHSGDVKVGKWWFNGILMGF